MAQSSLTPKGEDELSPMSLDAVHTDDNDKKKEKMSVEGTPETESKSATPPPSSHSPSKAKANGKANGTKKAGPRLIDYLPRAEEQALKMFEQLKDNHYQYSTLGRSKEALESMTCDCQFVPGLSPLF